jgi:hypothetical protein
MPHARSFSVVLIALLFAACGSGTNGPAPVNGILLRAADLPDMRLNRESPILPDAFAFEDQLGHGVVFKDPVRKVLAQLKASGYQRAYLEQFIGAGTIAGAFVAQFAPGKDLTGMLKYMNTNLFEDCPGDTQCSIKSTLSVSAIPGSYGQMLHPTRSASEGKDLRLYKVIFPVGQLIFGMEIGGDEVYDPGTVSQSQALASFKAFYNHVKAQTPDLIFASAPKTPLGPPPGRGGPTGVSTSVPPGGAPPTGSPS